MTAALTATEEVRGGRKSKETGSGFPLEGLMDFMAETITVFGALSRVLADEKEGILRSDARRLDRTNQIKEDLVVQMRGLEERRSTLWEAIGACSGRDPASITLSDLLEAGPTAGSEQFRASLSTLSDLLSEAKKRNAEVQEMVLGALNLIKGSVSLLTGLLNGQGVYRKTGAMGVGNLVGKLFSEAL